MIITSIRDSYVNLNNRQNKVRTALVVLTCVLTCLAAFVVSGFKWMFSVWFGTMEELLFTVTSLSGASSDMVWSFVLKCSSAVVITALLCLALHFLFIKTQPYIWSCIIYPLLMAGSILTIILSLSNACNKLDVKIYLDNQGASSLIEVLRGSNSQSEPIYDEEGNIVLSFIDSNYVDPQSVAITAPEDKRNLIMIYLESMEITYTDYEHGGAYETNYISELTELALDNISFNGGTDTLNGGRVLNYSSWTMGGLFTQSTGLPLNIPIGGNEMDSQEVFLPSVTAIGDILKENGYNQAFACGSDVAFGGRQAFFDTHGDYEEYDLNYEHSSGDLDPDYYVFWGFEDAKLLDYAKEHITEMAAQDEPFNYTLLTVDTHFPNGYECNDCEYGYDLELSSGYVSPYGNSLACSSKRVCEFIEWIREQDFYEDTTVVLVGDHLTMDANFCSDVSSDYERKVYTAYLNSAVVPVENVAREYTTEDTFPTVLAAMGFEIEGNRLGLGVNLFSDEPTLLEDYGYQFLYSEISKKSDLLTRIGSEVDLEAAAREYSVYNCSFSVSELDILTGSVIITVSDIISSEDVTKVALLIYSNEQQTDAIWYLLPSNNDSTYTHELSPDIYASDTCTVEAYCYTRDGTRSLMGKEEISLTDIKKNTKAHDLIHLGNTLVK